MVVETIAGSALIKAAESASAEIVKQKSGDCFDFIIDKYDLLKIKKYKSNFLDYCEKILFFRTLASPDIDVYIDDIYVPLKIKGVNELSLIVEDNVTLDVSNKPILIRGLAGQGKSTLLRKLVVNNMLCYGDRLPLYYELKNYQGNSIEKELSDYFNTFGINIRDGSFQKILDDSNVKLFLDAFDEVNPDYRDALLQEIDVLINRYNCHVVFTSRPGTQIDSLSGFDIYEVDELNNAQISRIIYKNSIDEEKAKQLCEALEKTPLHKGSESILRTPILVVLYTVSYNLGEEIPETLSQFYENIFDTVFFRHDNIKSRVKRERTWNDNRRVYREIFDCFCFLTQKNRAINFNRNEMVNEIKKAIDYVGKDSEYADKICDELCSITNLIIEDGFNEYKFVHRSIQEFFTSSFICSLEYITKCDFYSKCAKEYGYYQLFSNTLFFLEEIDYYDYSENYFVPSMNAMLKLYNKEIEDDFKINSDVLNTYLDQVVVHAKITEFKSASGKTGKVEMHLHNHKFKSFSTYPFVYSLLFNFVIEELMPVSIGPHIKNDDLVKYIVENGEYDKNENMSYLSINKLIDKFQGNMFNKNKVKENLEIAVHAIFRKKYNLAIIKLNNRRSQYKRGGDFDFT